MGDNSRLLWTTDTTKTWLGKGVSKNTLFLQKLFKKHDKVLLLLRKRSERIYLHVFQKTVKVEPGKGTSFFQKTDFNNNKYIYLCRIKRSLKIHKSCKKSTFSITNEDAQNRQFESTSRHLSFAVPKSAFLDFIRFQENNNKIVRFSNGFNQNNTRWMSYVTLETLFWTFLKLCFWKKK